MANSGSTDPTGSRTRPGSARAPLDSRVIWLLCLVGTPIVGFALHRAWRSRFASAALVARRAACVSVVVWLVAASLYIGDRGGARAKPAPQGPPPRGPAATPAAARPVTGGPAATILQIMIAYRREEGVGSASRTRREALDLATRLIDRIRGGESMERLVGEYTDDRGPDGEPFNGGSYAVTRNSAAVPAIKQAAFDTAVGALAPRPIDSGYAFHVIRRED